MSKKVKKSYRDTYDVDKSYCEKKGQELLDSLGAPECFWGAIKYNSIPEQVKANNIADAENVLDDIIEKTIKSAVGSKVACLDCNQFNKCWMMKLVNAIERLGQ